MSSMEGKLRRGGRLQIELTVLIKALIKSLVPSVNYKKFGIMKAWEGGSGDKAGLGKKTVVSRLKSLDFIQGMDETQILIMSGTNIVRFSLSKDHFGDDGRRSRRYQPGYRETTM